ncbi:hypothetical protein [Arthrobacter sp. Leaf69]|uniref:hypothetical protein n=1 Tax=Arthrobacter sp. Leaf69 TaxID=1736232 RepID=UPI0006F96D39|nr:hypothetical protein [Arthrobacter sp. Leaf69]KQN85054.1 hypothetical protein ASE96_15940 [Arthrobacter sp. Leaf69]
MSATELEATPTPSARRRRLVLIPVALLGLIGLALTYLFLTAQPEPSVPLGASASIPGGMASIGEIVPVEDDGWEPEDNDDALDGAPADGSHRVRVLVRITALEPGGLRLDTGDFSISGLGRERFRPLWESPPVVDLTQGTTAGATLIFEVPDRAIALVLDGPGGSRLSLGLSHHTP